MARLKSTLLIFFSIAVTVFLLKRCLGVFAITIPLLFMFFDVGYSVLVLWVWIKVFVFKYRVELLGTSVMQFHVLPADLDVFLHMNNSRYLRVLDFARFEHFLGSGLSSTLKKHGCGFILAATTIRYRRSLELFQKIQLTSQIIYWDGKDFYFEHRFVAENGFVSAVAFSKVAVIQMKKKGDQIPTKVLFEEVSGSTLSSPALPKDLEYWIDYNSLSSVALRPAAN